MSKLAKTVAKTFFISVFIALMDLQLSNLDAHAAAGPAELAQSIADELVQNQFELIVAVMAPNVAAELPAPKLAAFWHGLDSQFGGWKRFGPPALATEPTYDVVTIPIIFSKGTIDLKLSLHAGKIVGLFVAPHVDPVSDWQKPDYVDPATFSSMELKLGAAPMVLGGTLTLPIEAGPFPAVILVHGSGPGDRDESIGANRPFRDIAEGLASRGIAVYRYEKRTKVYPQSFHTLPAPTVQNETIDDVDAAVALLANRTDIDARRIVVLGHSLGGTLAPRIAAGNAAVRAIIIAAGATRPLPDIMVEQITYIAGLKGPLNDAETKQIAHLRLEAARALDAHPGDLGPPILGVPPSYWGDLNGYDPAATAAKLTIPILILQGDRDYQVKLADFDRFKLALTDHPNAELHVLKTLNHIFVAGTAPSTPDDYASPGHVDAGMIEIIAAFVKRLTE